MSRLTTGDRFALIVIQIIAFMGIFGGAIKWTRDGYSPSSLIFVVCGGIITALIVSGLICCKIPEASASSLSAGGDPPPKYRLTWRQEFLQSVPDHLKADIEKNLGLKTKKGKRSRGKQVVWTSDIETGVHQVRSSDTGPSTIGSTLDAGRVLTTANLGHGRDPSTGLGHLRAFPVAASSHTRSLPDTMPGHTLSSQAGPSLQCPNILANEASVSFAGSLSGRHVPVFSADHLREIEMTEDGLPSFEEARQWF